MVLSRLSRYLVREAGALYVFGVAAFCLLLSVDYLSLMAQFLLNQNATLPQVGQLLLFKLPAFLHLSIPVAGVFAVLLATGRLAKDSELKAAYALGVAPRALIAPLLLLGLFASGLAVLNNGWLEPLAERRYTALVDSFYYSRPPAEFQTNVAFSLPDGSIFYAAEMRADRDDPDLAELTGVLLLTADGLSIQAPRGTWDSAERVWHLDNAEQSRAGETPVLVGDLTTAFDHAGDPAATLVRDQLLTLSELGTRRLAAASSGAAVRDVHFEYHRRLADAFSAFCFVLVAAVLGVQVRGRSGAFALTIGLILGFYAVWTLSASLFERGVLGPGTAAWLTPMAVMAAGLLTGALRYRR